MRNAKNNYENRWFTFWQDENKIKQTKDVEEGKKRTCRTVKDLVSDLLSFFLWSKIKLILIFCCFLHYTMVKNIFVVFFSFFLRGSGFCESFARICSWYRWGEGGNEWDREDEGDKTHFEFHHTLLVSQKDFDLKKYFTKCKSC